MKHYEYYAYKDDDGREYDYYLTIPAVYFEAVLALLLRINPAKYKSTSHVDRSTLLIELLQQRIEQDWENRSVSTQASQRSSVGSTRKPYLINSLDPVGFTKRNMETQHAYSTTRY